MADIVKSRKEGWDHSATRTVGVVFLGSGSGCVNCFAGASWPGPGMERSLLGPKGLGISRSNVNVFIGPFLRHKLRSLQVIPVSQTPRTVSKDCFRNPLFHNDNFCD